jgi:energy-coupling factor transporter ATP-binding protein EcfA2
VKPSPRRPYALKPPPADALPPHSVEIELAALGCVLWSAIVASPPSMAEADMLLGQLRTQLFYDGRCRLLHDALAHLRMNGHAVDLVILTELFKPDKAPAHLQSGFDHLSWLPFIKNCMDNALVFNFPAYLDKLRALALRRWALAQSAKLSERASAGDVSVEELQEEFSDVAERAGRIGTADRPMIEFVKPSQAQAHVPNANTFLIGDNMVSRGGLTVIAGAPGLGKSRLATTLAVALARGSGKWVGYDVRNQAKTIIIQSQNSMTRIKQEFDDTPGDFDSHIRISKPAALRFSDAGFRRAVRKAITDFDAGCVIIDPWTGVAADEKLADYLEALAYVQDVCGVGELAPAVVIVAHLRKQRGGEQWRPKRGRDLMHELAGSFALAAEARTVFVVQQVNADISFPEVVIDCGKSNDGRPLGPQAFERRNGMFRPLNWSESQFDTWYGGDETEGKGKRLSEADLVKVMGSDRMTRKEVAAALVKECKVSPATAYRALEEDGKFADVLKFDADWLSIVEEA